MDIVHQADDDQAEIFGLDFKEFARARRKVDQSGILYLSDFA